MLKYLNCTMKDNANFNSDEALEFKEKFPTVLELISLSIENPFRPKRVLNSAVLEAVLVSLLEMDELITADLLTKRYGLLMSDRNFLDVISGGTTDTLVLKRRINIAKAYLEHGSFSDGDD